MLYKFRFKNKKDIYDCNLTKIKKAFSECLKSIQCVESQTGGISFKVTYYEKILNELYNNITISIIE